MQSHTKTSDSTGWASSALCGKSGEEGNKPNWGGPSADAGAASKTEREGKPGMQKGHISPWLGR